MAPGILVSILFHTSHLPKGKRVKRRRENPLALLVFTPSPVSERFRYDSDWNCVDEIRVQMGSRLKSQVGDDDKISQLPDAVLSHILSFLATKDAVRTSILSTRWKNIWASVPYLDFEHKYSHEPGYRSDHDGFVSFVDRVLYYRDSSDIQRFRLHFTCFDEDSSHVDGWVRTAIRRNVVELDLHVNVMAWAGEKMFELPKSVFLCKTLVVLKLTSSCFSYAPPKSGCFPNLKFLHIRIDYPDKDLMEKLFTYFPLLEDLTIEGKMPSDLSCKFKLFVPELKKLSINLDFVGTCEDPYEYYFSINSPKLEFLNLRVDILPSILLDNAKPLVKAVVDFDYHEAILHEHFRIRATKILAAISNVEQLSLSVHLFDASCIPAFDNLIHLKLVLRDCYGWEVLAELLKRTPNLECLVLEHKPDGDCNSDNEENSEDGANLVDNENLEDAEDKANTEDNENSDNEETSEDEEYSEHPWWNCQESVPVCLLSHLKTIFIRGFKGRRDEMQVAKYLLKNGEVLKNMTIYMGDLMCSKYKVYIEFLLFEKGSRTCRVQFV
ncbi:hypothetical protein ACLB2K_023145 [Fragaria x ananassa]